MIYTVPNNMFDLDMDAIVCPVNCQGIMGAGLALYFKMNYPWIEAPYIRVCQEGILQEKGVHMVSKDGVNIILLATKYHWYEDSSLELMEKALVNIALKYKRFKLKSIALPRIGCGLGKLDWVSQVYPLIKQTLEKTDLEVYCCV